MRIYRRVINAVKSYEVNKRIMLSKLHGKSGKDKPSNFLTSLQINGGISSNPGKIDNELNNFPQYFLLSGNTDASEEGIAEVLRQMRSNKPSDIDAVSA